MTDIPLMKAHSMTRKPPYRGSGRNDVWFAGSGLIALVIWGVANHADAHEDEGPRWSANVAVAAIAASLALGFMIGRRQGASARAANERALAAERANRHALDQVLI